MKLKRGRDYSLGTSEPGVRSIRFTKVDRGMLRGFSAQRDPELAVKELAEQIRIEDQALLLFFCSPDYDPKLISEACNREFDCPIIGCSTAGEIHNKFEQGGISGVSLPKNDFRVGVDYVPNLSEYSGDVAGNLVRDLKEACGCDNNGRCFALCLIDGLSGEEERFAAQTFGALSGIPLFGGSAGDNLEFKKTTVYCNEHFGSNSAALAIIHSEIPFEIFQLNHFSPTDTEIVVTSANPETRTVYELDGDCAAEVYAEIVGKDISELTPDDFSAHPVMVEVGGAWYVRSIQTVNRDGSLTFYCAIEEGVPLTIGSGKNFVSNLSDKCSQVEEQFEEVMLTIGCDCILRRLEMQQREATGDIERILEKLKFVGFSTFGEQINALHVNQTLTGAIFGSKKRG